MPAWPCLPTSAVCASSSPRPGVLPTRWASGLRAVCRTMGPGRLGSELSSTTLQVKVSMKFNGHSGVQLRAPRDLADLAAYTALKFYLQSPVPAPAPGENTGDRFVLYMGSRQVPAKPERGMGHSGLEVRNEWCLIPILTVSSGCHRRPLGTTWVCLCEIRRCTGCTG